jgi:hypothetical protein
LLLTPNGQAQTAADSITIHGGAAVCRISGAEAALPLPASVACAHGSDIAILAASPDASGHARASAATVYGDRVEFTAADTGEEEPAWRGPDHGGVLRFGDYAHIYIGDISAASKDLSGGRKI